MDKPIALPLAHVRRVISTDLKGTFSWELRWGFEDLATKLNPHNCPGTPLQRTDSTNFVGSHTQTDSWAYCMHIMLVALCWPLYTRCSLVAWKGHSLLWEQYYSCYINSPINVGQLVLKVRMILHIAPILNIIMATQCQLFMALTIVTLLTKHTPKCGDGSQWLVDQSM